MVMVVKGANALTAILLVGGALSGAITTQQARVAIEPLYEDEPEPPRYGPGTGKVPEGFEPTERDKAKMAAAEEKRARRNARNLRNLKG